MFDPRSWNDRRGVISRSALCATARPRWRETTRNLAVLIHLWCDFVSHLFAHHGDPDEAEIGRHLPRLASSCLAGQKVWCIFGALRNREKLSPVFRGAYVSRASRCQRECREFESHRGMVRYRFLVSHDSSILKRLKTSLLERLGPPLQTTVQPIYRKKFTLPKNQSGASCRDPVYIEVGKRRSDLSDG